MVKLTTSIDWRQLREFRDVDLARSYVLSWRVEGETLVVDVDVCLEAGHPFYELPRPAEKVCIRPAAIEFPFCDGIEVHGLERSEVSEIVEKIGIGAITGLRIVGEGRYEMDGEFGTVSIAAERPILRLKGH